MHLHAALAGEWSQTSQWQVAIRTDGVIGLLELNRLIACRVLTHTVYGPRVQQLPFAVLMAGGDDAMLALLTTLLCYIGR
jgi:hypothetical protein